MTRGDAQRIGDIWDRIIAARTAELYLVAAESAEDNGLVGVVFDAILYDLLVIGEAMKVLSAASATLTSRGHVSRACAMFSPTTTSGSAPAPYVGPWMSH